MKKRGFTIVELVVVMTIMAILISLGTYGAHRAQINARDVERRSDVEALARGLEERYKLGNPRVVSVPGNYTGPGGYPSVLEFLHIAGLDLTANGFNPAQVPGGYYTEVLPGTTAANFKAPGQTLNYDVYCFFCSAPGTTPENTAWLDTKVTVDRYIYEPLTKNRAQCNGEPCASFNLYYRTEADGVLHKISSKHQ